MIKVRVFDEQHEEDLEEVVNNFLKKIHESDVVDIQYQVATTSAHNEQIYCFTAMIIYRD
ncbi:MAG: sporulation protein Cse60 [Bacillaceae bacterium]